MRNNNAVTTSADERKSSEDAADMLIAIRNLRLSLGARDKPVYAIDGLNLSMQRRRTLCVVGESGCGKSMTARSIMRLVGSPGELSGEILLRCEPGGSVVDLVRIPQHGSQMRGYRGRHIAMIFQEPMTSLSPVHTIGNQIIEAIRQHEPISRADARTRAEALLKRVGIPRAAERLDDYTFQFSGGMRQRAMIAMALSCNPSLLIADEPTTALDVTTQAQILELMREIQVEYNMAIMFITHDLGVVAEIADDVAVMYLGRVVEHGPVEAIFNDPKHPYTRALLRSMPAASASRRERLVTIPGTVPDPLARPPGCPFHNRCDQFISGVCDKHVPQNVNVGPQHSVACVLYSGEFTPSRSPSFDVSTARTGATVAAPIGQASSDQSTLLSVEGLEVHFPIRRGILRRQVGAVKAVDGVDLTIRRGETLGLVGESGCGKTTVGRTIVRALQPSAGRILYHPKHGRPTDIANVGEEELKFIRARIRLIFQDPYSSLDPRQPVVDLIGEPIKVHGIAHGKALEERVASLLRKVGLRPEYMNRYSHAFSGGERQRISIARALALDPELVVCDEAVSALDVSVQAQILNLLQDLREELSLTLLFISHDLGVVRHICDRVAVMYLGRILELATPDQLFSTPRHPYTEALLSAAPRPVVGNVRPERVRLIGEPPDPANPPTGCPFHLRCAYSDGSRCASETPPLLRIGPEHVSACHYAADLQLRGADWSSAVTSISHSLTERPSTSLVIN